MLKLRKTTRGLSIVVLIIALCCTLFFVTTFANPDTQYEEVKDYKAYWTTKDESSNAKKHILLTGIPMPGHVFPLLATAEALALRGYTVTVTTLKHLERTVKNHKHPLVHYVPIGECQHAVDDWDKLTREMNSIVEFTESSNKIYDWVADVHPCIFSVLYSRLYRAQIKMDWNPATPDYNVLPPVDYIIADVVTHGAQDAARALNIRYAINNPDIILALPAQTMGVHDSVPVLFTEASVHEQNYGIEKRTFTQKFQNFNETEIQHGKVDPLVANDYDYAKVINQLESIRPVTPEATAHNDFVSYIFERVWNGSLFSRLVLPFARPVIQFWLYASKEPAILDRRHGISEIFFFYQLQHIEQLIKDGKMKRNAELQPFPFVGQTFAQFCEEGNGDANIQTYNAYLKNNYVITQFNIKHPQVICKLWNRFGADFQAAVDIFFTMPTNPNIAQEYVQTFEYLHSRSAPEEYALQSTNPQVKSLLHTFLEADTTTTLWGKLVNRWDSKIWNNPQRNAVNVDIALFNHTSHAQRIWSFYQQLSSYWSGLSTIPNVVTLQDTVFGVEYARPLPPYIHMVGPLIPKANSNVLSTSNPAMERQLTWLSGNDDDDETNNNDPIIYMSFGTLGHMNKEGTIALFHAYEYLVQTTKLRVLWKLTSHYVDMVVDAYLESGVNIEGFFDAVEAIPRGAAYLKANQGKINHAKIALSSNKASNPISHNRWFFTEWVYSQYGVLDHDNTAVFLSHCGINSAYESMLAKTYLLCIPLFGDQFDMANMIADRNTGAFIAKQYVNKYTLVSAIKYALAQSQTDNFKKASNRIKNLIKLAGGAERAADVLEFYINSGTLPQDGPVTATRAKIRDDGIDITTYRYTNQYEDHVNFEDGHNIAFLSGIQFNNLDVVLFYFTLFALILIITYKVTMFWIRLFSNLFCCTSRKRSVQQQQQQKQRIKAKMD